MNKISNFFSNISINIKNFINAYPITIILVIILTIYYAIFPSFNNIPSNLSFLFNTLILYFFGTLFTETAFYSKKSYKIMSFIINLIISFTLSFFVNKNINNDFISQCIIAYIGSLLILSIYFCIKNSKKNLGEYLINLFSNIFKTGTSYLILAIGFSIIYFIINNLLFENIDFTFFVKMHILLFGLFYVPSLIFSIYFTNEKESIFIKNLVLYVFIPLILISIIIIFLYILKIIITQEIPKNTIYRILAGIFIIAYPICNMAYALVKKEDKYLNIILNIIKYSLIPFVLLETYSIYLRIADYGLSPMRYLSIIFIIFQTFAIFLIIFKNRQKINYIFFIATALLLLVTITPLNLKTVSINNQTSRLESVLPEGKDFSKLSDEDKKTAYSSYSYLKSLDYTGKYIPDYLDENNINQLNSYSSLNYTINTENISLYSDNSAIDIRGYNTLHNFSSSSYYSNSKDVELIYGNKTIKIDLTSSLAEIVKIDKNSRQNYFNQNNSIIINENTKIIITNLYFSYNKDTNEFTDIHINGYILEK